MVIFMMYYELWNVLWNWKKEFTAKEFATVFVSPNPNKVLYDMTKKGLLERIGWGKYKVNSQEEYLSKTIDIFRSYKLLKEVDMKYSLTGPDAVFFWTKGGYQINRFFGFYPIHIKVKEKELDRWEKFFITKREKFYIKGQPVKETLFGVFYVLYINTDFEVEEIDGFQVDPLEDAVKFCQKKIYSYEPALEMLDEMYNLGLEIEYKETKTNF